MYEKYDFTLGSDPDSEDERADFILARQMKARNYCVRSLRALANGDYYEFMLNYDYFKMANLQLPWQSKIPVCQFSLVEKIAEAILHYMER